MYNLTMHATYVINIIRHGKYVFISVTHTHIKKSQQQPKKKKKIKKKKKKKKANNTNNQTTVVR